MNTQADKNSVRYAVSLYRARQKRKNTSLKLGLFFSMLIPAFSALLIFLISRPV